MVTVYCFEYRKLQKYALKNCAVGTKVFCAKFFNQTGKYHLQKRPEQQIAMGDGELDKMTTLPRHLPLIFPNGSVLEFIR